MPFTGMATSHKTEEKMKRIMVVFAVLLVLATACTSVPTPTPVPPTTTSTSIPPTATLVPPTATAIPPTATAIPPTATAIPPTATAIPPTATPQATKQVTLIYVEGSNPVSAKELWLSYYDENTKTWVTKKGTTDKDGVAIFSVPGGKSGESFTFTFAFSESEVNKFIDEIKGGKRNGLRIPPDPTQTGITLKTDSAYHLNVIGGSIQMWVPK
jgi:hypothetical protein